MARPLEYTKEIGDEICSKVADGISLRKICSKKNMPGRGTVYRWLAAVDEFRDQYAQAKGNMAEDMADEISEIADNEDGDVMRDRLRVDTRKWLMSKLIPKKYGDKQTLTMDATGEYISILRNVSGKNAG